MNKTKIDPFEYSSKILSTLDKGILLTSKNDKLVNTMTIAWGTIGIQWKKPIFMAFVKTRRYTRSILDENPYFTINVPFNAPIEEKETNKIIAYCGTKSGLNTDKIKDLGLTLVDSNKINVPAIKEFPLTLECKIIYRQAQIAEQIPEDILKRYYANKFDENVHVMYIGEILDSYIIED